jgi:hypothetical protein
MVLELNVPLKEMSRVGLSLTGLEMPLSFQEFETPNFKTICK